jgi:L-alanine-DL-glutamate epimerase-like enolase superfamily enzyme
LLVEDLPLTNGEITVHDLPGLGMGLDRDATEK